MKKKKKNVTSSGPLPPPPENGVRHHQDAPPSLPPLHHVEALEHLVGAARNRGGFGVGSVRLGMDPREAGGGGGSE